ncbi:MAG TPA: hypothetical protein VF943_06400 [Burkholderiales bacterium]
MATLHEWVILPDGEYEFLFEGPSRFLLRYGRLVEYRDGVRRVRGRRLPYTFRSIEQLRYDFERDVEAA